MCSMHLHFSRWFCLIVGYTKEGLLSIQEDKKATKHILPWALPAAVRTKLHVPSLGRQGNQNLFSVCFRKLLKFHLKRNTKESSGQKRVGGQFKNSRPSPQWEFWDVISPGSKKRVWYYVFARILYKRRCASALISSVWRVFPSWPCQQEKPSRGDDVSSRNPPQPCQLSPPGNTDTGYK